MLAKKRRRIEMKKWGLLIMVALCLTLNVTALTWGGVDFSKWGIFGTNDNPQDPKK